MLPTSELQQNHEAQNCEPLNAAAGTELQEQARRAAFYSLLAALLRDAPDREVLDYCMGLEGDDRRSDLGTAVSTLVLAARHSSPERLRDEFHPLFIGLGRGELVPYGSWYQTGFLMEKPLGQLRADLAALGFERDDKVHEPEDHIAALFEVMAMLIQDGTELEVQRRFHDTHIAPWARDFMADMEKAESTVFYKSVARLGAAFLSVESRYLSLLG
jgi:TorA maturation chaperone TorD